MVKKKETNIEFNRTQCTILFYRSSGLKKIKIKKKNRRENMLIVCQYMFDKSLPT